MGVDGYDNSITAEPAGENPGVEAAGSRIPSGTGVPLTYPTKIKGVAASAEAPVDAKVNVTPQRGLEVLSNFRAEGLNGRVLGSVSLGKTFIADIDASKADDWKGVLRQSISLN